MGPTIADLYLMGLDPGLSSLLLAFTRQGWLFVFCLALKLKFSQIMTFPPISKWGRVSSHSSDSPPFRDFIILSVKNAWVKHLPTAIHINTIWLASGLSGLSLKISAITPVLFFSAGGQLYHETSLCSSWANEMVFEGGRRGRPPSCCLQVFRPRNDPMAWQSSPICTGILFPRYQVWRRLRVEKLHAPIKVNTWPFSWMCRWVVLRQSPRQ